MPRLENEAERARWNRKHAEARPGQRPDPFLAEAWEEYVSPLFPAGGHALDLAGGAGRHARWLARAGWKVTLADISDVAVARARRGALRPLLRVRRESADQTLAARTRYELVLVFYFLERRLFTPLAAALKPGGLLVYKTFGARRSAREGGPRNPAFRLRPNELLRAFSGLEILLYRESVGEQATAELVARKRKASSAR